jgi:hypothetical protein
MVVSRLERGDCGIHKNLKNIMIKISGDSSEFTVQVDSVFYYAQLVEYHEDDTETWGIYIDENYEKLIAEIHSEQPLLDEESMLDITNQLLKKKWKREDVEIEFN